MATDTPAKDGGRGGGSGSSGGASTSGAAPLRQPQNGHRASELDVKQMTTLCVTNFAQGVMLTLPFTIAVYMARCPSPHNTVGCAAAAVSPLSLSSPSPAARRRARAARSSTAACRPS
jgi:hypothetical protein